MASDRSKLRELAAKARDAWVGTWPRHESQPATCRNHGKFVCTICFSDEAAKKRDAIDYLFAAAASPDVVTELLDLADSADERVRAARIESYREVVALLAVERDDAIRCELSGGYALELASARVANLIDAVTNTNEGSGA